MVSQGFPIPEYRIARRVCLYRHDYTNPQVIVKVKRTVEIPVLPGCVTWGDTRAEAALMAEDAVQGWLVTALRFGDKIPEIDGFTLSHLSDIENRAEMVYA
jgi:predicted RNase H-like HicB family nuclease